MFRVGNKYIIIACSSIPNSGFVWLSRNATWTKNDKDVPIHTHIYIYICIYIYIYISYVYIYIYMRRNAGRFLTPLATGWDE